MLIYSLYSVNSALSLTTQAPELFLPNNLYSGCVQKRMFTICKDSALAPGTLGLVTIEIDNKSWSDFITLFHLVSHIVN